MVPPAGARALRYLLDSQIFVWHLTQPSRIPIDVEAILESPDSDLVLSLASIWELSIKSASGRLPLPRPTARFVAEGATARDIDILPITIAHLEAVESLPYHHRDPFDRLIVAQGMVENLTIISADAAFSQYEAPLLLVPRT